MVLNQMSTSGSSFQLCVFGLGLLCINWHSAVDKNMSGGVSTRANFRGGAYGHFKSESTELSLNVFPAMLNTQTNTIKIHECCFFAQKKLLHLSKVFNNYK